MRLFYKCLQRYSPDIDVRRMLFLFFFILTAGLITSHAQTIQGTVYRDFNANGTKPPLPLLMRLVSKMSW